MQGALQMKPNAVLQSAAVSDPSDEELMARLQGHDTSALNTLFSRYSRVVFGIAFRVLHDAGESEEVVQESFLYLYQKVKLFDPSRGSAKIWIVQIAYSRAKDQKAHLSRRGFYLRTDIGSLELDETLAAGADVEREIAAKLDFNRLEYAFNDLTSMQRQTLKLFYFEGLALKEISEQLQEPLGNVRHHFYRGIERLRRSAVTETGRKNQHARI
jgi:RNA polymerase sigma-70 factor (ECF subfamily)